MQREHWKLLCYNLIVDLSQYYDLDEILGDKMYAFTEKQKADFYKWYKDIIG